MVAWYNPCGSFWHGDLDAALERGAAAEKSFDQGLLSVVRDRIVADCIGMVMKTCEWELQL
jgi:hypothetical protein